MRSSRIAVGHRVRWHIEAVPFVGICTSPFFRREMHVYKGDWSERFARRRRREPKPHRDVFEHSARPHRRLWIMEHDAEDEHASFRDEIRGAFRKLEAWSMHLILREGEELE